MTSTKSGSGVSEEFVQYRRKQIAELADWQPGFNMTGVSVSDADKVAGSPKLGDKIARNPVNHADRWLVAAAYFADNFEPVTLRAARQDAGAQELDLAMTVRRLAARLKLRATTDADKSMVESSLAFLAKHGLQGSPLRDEPAITGNSDPAPDGLSREPDDDLNLAAALTGIYTHIRQCVVNGAPAYPNLQGDADVIERAAKRVALRSLSQPAERVSGCKVMGYVYHELSQDGKSGHVAWTQSLDPIPNGTPICAMLSASPGAAGEGK